MDDMQRRIGPFRLREDGHRKSMRFPIALVLALLALVTASHHSEHKGVSLSRSATASWKIFPASFRSDEVIQPRQSVLSKPSWLIVGLGDSVTAGSYCHCTPFIARYSAALTDTDAASTMQHNLGMPSATSGSLVETLSTDKTTQDAVGGADIVVVTIGANDFHDSDLMRKGCNDVRCFAGPISTLQKNLTTIVNRIRVLRRNQATAIRLTGYWQIWKDGAVARKLGRHYLSVNDALTRNVNSTIAQVAFMTGTGFVDLYRPFRGDGDADDTQLLASDGDHPNASGHSVIANALLSSGTEPLTA